MERTFLTKSEFRGAVRAQICSLSPSERATAAMNIARQVECDARFIAAQTVAVFMPLGDEPPIREAVERWAAEKSAAMFIDMWKSRKSTRKQPEILITSFLPIDELQRKLLID